MKLQNEVMEHDRVQKAVKERQGVSLREDFNMNLYQRPQFKKVEREKWKDPRGMSYEG